jgi:hypothetical protein
MARPSGSEDGGGALELIVDGDVDGAVEDSALEVSPVQPVANRRAAQMSAAPLRIVSIRRLMHL